MDQEELFLLLQQPQSSISTEKTSMLLELGYINTCGEKTSQAKSLVDSFIKEREAIVYQAVMSSIDDFEAFFSLRDEGQFKRHQAFLAVVRHLGSQGRILKKN